MFIVLWTEGSQADQSSIMSGKEWSRNSYNEWVYTKVRRFIVVHSGSRSCVAVPITTNSGEGAAKSGERKSDYCIVYGGTGPAPRAHPAEVPSRSSGEAPMQTQPIRVDLDQGEKLDPMSRINLGAPQSIQHYAKVRSIGKVNPKSEAAFRLQFQHVMNMAAPAAQSATQTITSGGSHGDTTRVNGTTSEADDLAKLTALLSNGYSREQAMEILRIVNRTSPQSAFPPRSTANRVADRSRQY